jgi:GTPase SAR1 family protein
MSIQLLITKSQSTGQLPLRIALCGLPSSGKSSLINSLVGRRVAETGMMRTTIEPKLYSDLISDDGYSYEIYDLPGINDVEDKTGSFDNITYDIIEEVDCILWVSDIKSAFLTAHETTEFTKIRDHLRKVSLNTGKCYHIGIVLSKCNINIYADINDNINDNINETSDVNNSYDFSRINIGITSDHLEVEIFEDEITAGNEETGITEIINKITKLFPNVNIDYFNAYGRCSYKKTSATLLSLVRKMSGSLYISEYNIDFNLAWVFRERPISQNNTTMYHIFHTYIFPWFESDTQLISVVSGCNCQKSYPFCYCGRTCSYRPIDAKSTDVSECLRQTCCGKFMSFYENPSVDLNALNTQIAKLNNIDMLMDFILINNAIEFEQFKTSHWYTINSINFAINYAIDQYNKQLNDIDIDIDINVDKSYFKIDEHNVLCSMLKIPHHLINNTRYKTHVEKYTEKIDDSSSVNNELYIMKCSNIIMRFGILYGIDKLYYAQLYYKFLHNIKITHGHEYKMPFISHYFYASAFINSATDIQKLYLPKYTQMNYELIGDVELSTSRAFVRRVTDARIALGLDVTDVIVESLIQACLQRDVYCGLFRK